MKAEGKKRPVQRGRAVALPVYFSGVQSAALSELARHFLNRPGRRPSQKAFVVQRLVSFALRDIQHTRAVWDAFLRYCEAEGFPGPEEKLILLDRQIELAWATSKAARELRGVK